MNMALVANVVRKIMWEGPQVQIHGERFVEAVRAICPSAVQAVLIQVDHDDAYLGFEQTDIHILVQDRQLCVRCNDIGIAYQVYQRGASGEAVLVWDAWRGICTGQAYLYSQN